MTSTDHPDATTMSVVVNGTERDVPVGTTVTALLADLGLPDRGVAVAVDGAVHPRSEWDGGLGAGARVEVLTAVQGG